MTRDFYIKTLGCKVNQCDSREIREEFLKFGFKETRRIDEAGIFIVNTCCVTSAADRKSRLAIRGAARSKKNKSSILVVVGCYADYDCKGIGDIEGVDAVFSNAKKQDFFQWARQLAVGDDPQTLSSGSFPEGRTRGFLKIQEGCDNRCSYCVVPLVRGPSKSRDFSLVLNEARRLVEAGHRELVLTGVNLGAFGKDLSKRRDLVGFITALEEIEGLSRIRLSSVEATEVTDALIDKMGNSLKLCPHLHIPFQSGDDNILKDMNKKVTVKDYKDIINRARRKIKNLSITADLIIGYPGESESHFKNTLKFIQHLKPLKVHLFTFSPRRGTALSHKGTKLLPAAVVKERFRVTEELCTKLSFAYKREYVGRNLSVLFEENTRKGWQGYSKNYIRVCVASKIPLWNRLAEVKVTEAGEQDVTAVLEKIPVLS